MCLQGLGRYLLIIAAESIANKQTDVVSVLVYY
jgi:hypothetical protein